MQSKKYVIIEAIFNLQIWVKENLPIENSLVAYDLILLLSIHNYANSKITVKHLFASLPHSPTAVRYHYQRLINDGWLEHQRDLKDRRIKYVQPTTKFIEIINAYTLEVNQLLSNKIEIEIN